MELLSSISELPQVPCVYAMYGGRGPGRYVAYVGIGKSLKPRVVQHLVRRDSSVTTGTSAVQLNPDYDGSGVVGASRPCPPTGRF